MYLRRGAIEFGSVGFKPIRLKLVPCVRVTVCSFYLKCIQLELCLVDFLTCTYNKLSCRRGTARRGRASWNLVNCCRLVLDVINLCIKCEELHPLRRYEKRWKMHRLGWFGVVSGHSRSLEMSPLIENTRLAQRRCGKNAPWLVVFFDA